MFDNVFDDKQWKSARDKTGLKGGLTEKVSMGDEFKRFHQNKTVATAKVLQQKIALYEKQLKEKHSKEKYYANLLKVVHDQQTAIEAGIQAAEKPANAPTNATPEKTTPVQDQPKTMTDKEMDDFANEIVAREQEHLRGYENTTNDPNAPAFPEAKRIYFQVTKDFPTVEGKIKAEQTVVTDLLQKCKALETNPALKAKPDIAVAVAQKIIEALNKIELKSTNLHSDFVIEARKLHKEEGRDTPATKALDGLVARLDQEMNKIVDIGRACRLSLKTALQLLGTNAQAQQLLAQLHV
jgi:hypothetical protein